MAKSGSIDFSLNRNQLIELAFYKLGTYSPYESIPSQDMIVASNQLNLMIKSWQLLPYRQWVQTEARVFLEKGKISYNLNSSTGDHIANEDDVVETTTTAVVAASATTVALTTTTGMAASDNIGIVLSDNTRHWTTIVSVDSSTQVTITTGPTTQANSGASVSVYTSKIERPLRVLQTRHLDIAGYERPCARLNRRDYFDTVDKDASTATTTAFYYDCQLDTGKLYIWGSPSTSKESLRITYQRTLNDMDSSIDDFDLPQEWQNAIMWNLVVQLGLSGEYGKVTPRMIEEARQLKYDVMTSDQDPGDFQIYPEYRDHNG